MHLRLFRTLPRLILPALATIACSPKSHPVSKIETREYAFSDSSNNLIDSTLYKKIKPYHDRIAVDMSVVLGESETTLEKGTPESTLGNFVADACFVISSQSYYPADNKPADFAFFNNGGLRNPLPKGKITRGDIFGLMPFENELVILTLDGAVVKKLINFIASKDGAPVSGLRFRIVNKQAVDISIHNQPFDSTKTYKALTSDYLANGGDQFSFLSEALVREPVNLKVRDAIIQYLGMKTKMQEKISVPLDGRISYGR